MNCRWKSLLTGLAAALFGAVSFAALPGCDTDRDVMEVETPEGELEVEQDRETGELDVETD